MNPPKTKDSESKTESVKYRPPGPPERERERERESFIRNNLHNGVVSGAARGQALLGPMWAGLTPDSKGDPTSDTEEPVAGPLEIRGLETVLKS